MSRSYGIVSEKTVTAIIQDLLDIPENGCPDCEAYKPGTALCTNLNELTAILRRHILGEEGGSETVVVPDGEYYILTTHPCYVDSTRIYPHSGTDIVTIKRRKPKPDEHRPAARGQGVET